MRIPHPVVVFRSILPCCVAWCIALCVASTARADVGAEPIQGAITVTSTAGGRCPDSEQLEARVDALLRGSGRARRRLTRDGVGIVVRFAADKPGIRAELELFGARSGRRVLNGNAPSCSELADSVALALAILIDPSFTPAVPPEPRRTPHGALTPAAQHRSARARSDTGPKSRSAQLAGRLFVGGGLTAGLTTSWAPAGSGGVELDFDDAVALRTALLWLPGSEVSLPPGQVRIQLVAATFDACLGLLRLGAGVRVSPCAGVARGWIEATARGYRDNARAGRGWLALDAGLVADIPITKRLGLWVSATSFWPAKRQDFAVEGAGRVRASTIPGGSLLAGASVLFR